MDDEEKSIRKILLRKFYRHGYWGNKHMREDHLTGGFPGHLKGKVEKIAEELARDGLLRKLPTSHGGQWSANIKMLKQIEEEINDC